MCAPLTLALAFALAALGLLPGTPVPSAFISLAHAIGYGGTFAGLYLFAGFGYGALLARLLWRSSRSPGLAHEETDSPLVSADRPEVVAVVPGSGRMWAALALGPALMLWLSHLAGWLGLWRVGPLPAIALVAIGIILALWAIARELARRPAIPALVGSGLLAVPAVAVMLIAAASAPGWLWGSEFGGFDALSYHLSLPLEWGSQGRLVPLPHNVYSYLPSYLEAAFLHLHIALGGGGPTAGAAAAVPAAVPVAGADAGADALSGSGLFAFQGAGVLACQYLSAGYALIAAVLTGRVATSVLLQSGFTAPARPTDSPACTASEPMLAQVLGALAGTLVLVTPWTVVTGSLAYNETATMACFAGAMLVAIQPSGVVRRALLAGLLVGVACGCKPTAAFLIAPTIGTLLVWNDLRTRRPGAVGFAVIATVALIAAVMAAVGVAVAFGPPLVRNALATGGNPVFPAGAAVFGSAHWTGEQVERFAAAHRELAPFSTRVAMLFGPSPLGGDGQPRGMLHGQFSLLWPLVTLGLGLTLASRKTRAFGLAVAVGIGSALLWWLIGSHCQSRFLAPLVPIGSALVAVGVGSVVLGGRPNASDEPNDQVGIWSIAPGRRLVLLGTLACAGLMSVSCLRLFLEQQQRELGDSTKIAIPNARLVGGIPAMTGQADRATVIELEDRGDDNALAALDPVVYINALVPEDTTIYLLGDSTPFYFAGRLMAKRIVYHTTWDRSPLGEVMRAAPNDPEAWTRQLRASGIKMVLVSSSELARLTQSKYYDPAVTLQAVSDWLAIWGKPVRAFPASGHALFELRTPPSQRSAAPSTSKAGGA